MFIKYVTKIGQNVHIFGRDELLSCAQFAALFNPANDHVRDQFRAFGLGNKEGSQTNPILFSSKPVLLLEVPEPSALSVKIARVTKEDHHSGEDCVIETFLRESAAKQVCPRM
jgi:hypothetical protein